MRGVGGGGGLCEELDGAAFVRHAKPAKRHFEPLKLGERVTEWTDRRDK